MCGRFALFTEAADLVEQFGIEPLPVYAPRYNIAPSQPLLTVVFEDGNRRADWFNWGLLPSWAKDPKASKRPINARAETVAEKPSFRAAYRRRRCLVPASGYYEWVKVAGAKQPYYIEASDAACFAIAALWEYWERDGSAIITTALLTSAANDNLAAIHHRMPVVINPEHYALWLDPHAAASDIDPLLQPSTTGFNFYPVSTRVNSPANDSVECIEQVVTDAT